MWSLIFKNKGSKLLLFYNLFFTLSFYTPALYYFLGFSVYSHAFTAQALDIFCTIGIIFSLVTIIWMKTRLNSNRYWFFNFFTHLKSKALFKSFNIRIYFVLGTCLMLFYLIFFFNKLTVVNIFSAEEGELVERLDTSGSIPFYITFSSLFIILFPTIFFFFYTKEKNRFYKLIFFILTVFAIGSGGNRGILTYFFIFFIFFFSKKIFNFWKIGLGSFVLITYYLFSKGVDFSDTDNLGLAIESPFRRFFVTQPVGFIARIQMHLDNSFDVNSTYSIKQQVFSKIYQAPLGTGSHPSHFVSSILVEYGYLPMFLSFLIFNIFLLELIKTCDNILNDRIYGFVTWNIFIFMFLTFNSDLSVANILRFSFIFLNLIILYFFTRNEQRI
ncbi:hypothetical protein [Nonlabens ulvanivorans]|uniref:Oligosaccharide repeat unit polymerase Wzy n=1 Tax=Nonlabens ulvanivorans TaxID=906888 RepID=A0A084JVY7_NONUL|nr:hypothetical protein [Nonlabens ulvanivorans]KEZ93121.1 hypothetical protein IL45_13445 [Nonlabens ulvanivorans]PRX13759.1 hypothetical protein LY02_02007 [Nonlabens ulvanivorans]